MNVMGPRDRHDLQLLAKVLDIVQVEWDGCPHGEISPHGAKESKQECPKSPCLDDLQNWSCGEFLLSCSADVSFHVGQLFLEHNFICVCTTYTFYQRLYSTKYRMNRKTPKVIPSWLAYLEWCNN